MIKGVHGAFGVPQDAIALGSEFTRTIINATNADSIFFDTIDRAVKAHLELEYPLAISIRTEDPNDHKSDIPLRNPDSVFSRLGVVLSTPQALRLAQRWGLSIGWKNEFQYMGRFTDLEQLFQGFDLFQTLRKYNPHIKKVGPAFVTLGDQTEIFNQVRFFTNLCCDFCDLHLHVDDLSTASKRISEIRKIITKPLFCWEWSATEGGVPAMKALYDVLKLNDIEQAAYGPYQWQNKDRFGLVGLVKGTTPTEFGECFKELS